jgi:hypothetical protein
MKKLFLLTALTFLFYAGFSQTPLYRYYNGKQKKHYYTIDFNEFGNGRNGWGYEGVTCLVFTDEDRSRGIIPVYRFVDRQSNDHYYNVSRHIARVDLRGYSYEGPVFTIAKFRSGGMVPLFEYYNERTGDHFYTADKHELGRGYEGYHFDEVVGFVLRK